MFFARLVSTSFAPKGRLRSPVPAGLFASQVVRLTPGPRPGRIRFLSDLMQFRHRRLQCQVQRLQLCARRLHLRRRRAVSVCGLLGFTVHALNMRVHYLVMA